MKLPPQVQLITLLLCAATLLSGCKTTLFATINTTDQRHDIQQQRNIAFDPPHHLALDIYRPEHVAHAPIVVFIYGGSWTHGERQWYRFVGTALAARGVIAVIPDYRKYPQVKMDGFMQDAAEALAWAHQHASELGGSGNDVFVMGHSAGGQIAALLATDPQWLAPYGMQPHDLAGFIGLAGCYDFAPIASSEKDMLDMFGRTLVEQQRAQAVTFVHGAEPPMLLLHGTADKEVDPSNSISLTHVMQAQHEDVTLQLYPGIGHVALLFALLRPMHGHAPTLEDILAFIHRHPSSLADTAKPHSS